MIEEVEPGIAAEAFVGDELGPAGHRLLDLLDVDHSVFLHAVEDVRLALAGAIGVPLGVEIIRTLGQAGEQRAFTESELRGALAEIAARRQLDTPCPAAEIDRIEVERENLRFAEHALEPGCDEDLADLALIGDVVSDQQVLGHLLRDRRAALRPSGLRQISDERPDHSALVNTLVLEE